MTAAAVQNLVELMMLCSVCIASIVVLVESALFNPQTKELPKDIAAIMIWATVEVNLAIVSGTKSRPFLINLS